MNRPQLQFLFPIKNPPERCHFTLPSSGNVPHNYSQWFTQLRPKTNSVEKACFIFLKWESWWREKMFFEDWRRLSMFKTIDNRSFKAGLTTKLPVLICCSGRVDYLILIHFCTLCRHVMKKLHHRIANLYRLCPVARVVMAVMHIQVQRRESPQR